MDEDRVAGAAKEFGGKVKDAVGGAVGDSGTEAQGKADRALGVVQNAYGSAKDAVRDNAGGVLEEIEDFVQERPVLALLAAAGVGFMLGQIIDRS